MMMRKSRCSGGRGLVRVRRISKRAYREFKACWEICDPAMSAKHHQRARTDRLLTFDHAFSTTGNQGFEYNTPQ